MTRTRKHWALMAIALLAAFLRLYRIAALPPGDGYDPAWYGVDALQILDGQLPVYLPTNIGREALFSYLVALSVAVVGIGPHAIHLAAAVVGVLTVPATYLAAEALLAEEREPLRSYGGLVSALAVTVSFWHQHWSRYGVRAILVPLFAALVVWALARMLTTQDIRARRRHAILAGVFLGLSLYTYQSARVLPVLTGCVVLIAVTSRRRWSTRIAGDLVRLVAVAGLIFAPMGLYFIRHPGVGNERIEQTWSIAPDKDLTENARAVWAEVVDALRVLALEGDNEVIHNLPGRPAMNAFLVALLGLGAAVALSRLGRWPYWLLLLWVPAMSVTVFLTLGGQPTKRALGALPALAIVIAVGALAPLTATHGLAQGRGSGMVRVASAAWVVILVCGFAYSAYATYRDYFLVWGRDPNLWTHFEGGRVAIGQYARTLPGTEVIYSSPEMPDHPSIIYNSGGRTDLKGFNGRLCTVVPSVTRAPTTYIIVQHEESQSLERLRQVYPNGAEIPAGPDYYGQPYFTAYRLPAGLRAAVQPEVEAVSTWGGAVRFQGYDVASPTTTPGSALALTLYTASVSPVDADYVQFVHLISMEEHQNPATGNALWAQDDSEPCRGFYPTSVWAPGEIVIDHYTLQVPADAPPGSYRLQVGFYTWPNFEHLMTTDVPGGEPEVVAPIGVIEIGAAP